MRILKTFGFRITILALLLSGCSTMPRKPEVALRGDYGYTKEYASWLIRQEMDAHGVTGLSIALVDDQKVVWAQGFGYADKARDIPAAPDTVYRTGPISQLFTATAVMQLADDRALNIDQPLQTYLPDFTVKSRFSYAAPITPRTLLTHHSGLPSDRAKGMWTRHPEPVGEELPLLRDEYTAAPPDYAYSPSTIGMSILGHLLEKTTGRDFVPHMSISLFLPLRMTGSAFSSRIDHSPQGSRAYSDGDEAEEPPLRDVPALGLNSTVLDLSRFVSMVFADGWAGNRIILREMIMAEMLRPQNSGVLLDHSLRVGLGWMLDSPEGINIRNGGPVAQIGGGTLYHRSRLAILPGQKLGVVVLANSASAAGMVDRVAAETLKLALEAKTGITQTEQRQLPEAPDNTGSGITRAGNGGDGIPAMKSDAEIVIAELNAQKQMFRHGTQPEQRKMLTDDDLQAFEGSYATMTGVVKIRKSTEHLEAVLFGQSVRLAPRPDGLLGMSLRLPAPFGWSRDGLEDIGIDRATVDGRDVLKMVIGGQEFLAGEHLKQSTIPERWLQRLGSYEIVNAGDDTVTLKNIRLRHDTGLLVAEYELPYAGGQTLSRALKPLSGDEAVTCGVGRGGGETVRVVNRGGEELLAYSGYLLRKKMR